MTAASSSSPAHHLGLVTLVVPDYDEAIAYYTRTLGLQLVEDTPLPSAHEPGKRWVVVAPPGALETRLLLARAATPAQRARVGDQTGGRVALFLHTADFEATHAQLQAAGVTFEEPPREEPYGTVAVFHDVYGNRWDLLQPTTAPPTVQAMTVLVASVIVHDEATDRIVMLQRGRKSKFGNGLWDLPTGKSEPGEPVTVTAARELQEETGLVVKPESLRMVHALHGAVGTGAPNGYLVVVFATHEWSGVLENREPTKHAQVRWADLRDTPAPLVPSTAKMLHAYTTGDPELILHRWE
jgi:8-oxo-dGTP pyrophosphatase MutT (NUDIX family)/uncharacterized glyoxalase superfamily protein PhnB